MEGNSGSTNIVKDERIDKQNCSFTKASTSSPLNSAMLQNIDYENNTENSHSSLSENSTADVMLLNLQIGERRLSNIAIKSDTLLQDLAEEFGENESVQVAYFLNERIKKGGKECNAMDAQVMVKLKSNWRWIPVEDLVDDPSATIEEAFAGLQSSILFNLSPKSQRDSIDEPCIVPMETDMEKNGMRFVQRQTIQESTEPNIKEIRTLLKRIDTLLPDESYSTPRATLVNKQTQTSHYNITGTSSGHEPLNSLCSKISVPQTDFTAQRNSVASHLHSLSEGSQINISLHQPEEKITENTPCFIEQLANDLPTQAFNGIQIETKAKSPDENTATPLSRNRVQFDRNFETPLLKDWFEENPVPSKRMITNYVDELNSSEARKGKDPVTYRAVYIWFKNTRARSLKKKNKSESA